MTAPVLELSRPVERPARHVLSGPPRRRISVPPDGRALLVPLGLLVPLVALHRLWIAQILLLALLLTVPGAIALRALRVPEKAVAAFPVYLPCASLVVLLGSGLAVDLLGPVAGIEAPLRPWPLLIGLELVCLILLGASVNAPPGPAIPWRGFARPGRMALPLALPLMAAAGALRLNTDHGNGVALIALCCCVLVTIALFAYAPRFDVCLLAVGLYSIALAMLWSFSLRGVSVYGFDISDEYYVLQHTITAGVWTPVHPDNAYAALLSTTVLPAELHAVTGVSALMVFKVIYPAVSALIPVAVFYLGRQVLSSRWAFAAGALIITQSGFGQEIPAIARQEIALVLFTALLAAVLDITLPRRIQWPLMLLFALAMTVSHYTTTYVTATVLGLALILQPVAFWFRPAAKVSASVAVAFAAATVAAAVWYGPVTHSSSNVVQLVTATRSQGLDLLPNRSQAGGLVTAYLDGNTVTPITPHQYAELVHKQYEREKPFVHPLPDAGHRAYALRASTTPTPPVKLAPVYNAFGLAEVIAQQLIYLLAAAGSVMLVFRRRVPAVARQLGLLAAATLVFLVAIRFSGTLAAFYNAERALLQAMVILDIPLFWCIQVLAGRRPPRLTSTITGAAAAAILVIFAAGNGLVGAVLGGGTASNLADSGYDYEQFYVTAPELASATWLGERVQRGQLVYTDEYGQLPLVTVTGISSGLLLDVTPGTLDDNAWVYASRTNVIDGNAYASFGGHSVSYRFPTRFLTDNYNLVYTNGSAEVYHR